MKNFHLTDNYALINFDSVNFYSNADIITSKGFDQTLKLFYKSLKDNNHIIIDSLTGISATDINDFYKLLLIYDLDAAVSKANKITAEHIKVMYEFTELFYNFWRKLERFGMNKGSKNYDHSVKVHDIITVGNDFNATIIDLYRTISQKLLGSTFHIYRQLPAGINANFLYVMHKFTSDASYSKVQNIPFVTKIVTSPPFIINSKSNTRSKLFSEMDYNPLPNLNINKLHYYAFPVKVGPLLAFVYVHRDFLHHGIALSNLFEFASYDEFKSSSPELVFVYGIDEDEYDCKYYIDEKTNIHTGFVSRMDANDYFGYIKKMLLTLHNVYMINNGKLPIHGAMANITLSNNIKVNVAIIGDSGAGKSETLEALRSVGGKKIRHMDIIFDDMGTFKLKDGHIVANGTETGAFVRLDDLDTGYAYEIMDRALFLNPNQVNARVVIPTSSYALITTNHKIDILLYANNYDTSDNTLSIFNNIDVALKTFKEGSRVAKGTTNETGLVKTFFANPFGPVQLQAKTNVLIDDFFKTLASNGTVIGELFTKLAVSGYESSGPHDAAKSLLKYMLEHNTNL